MFYLSSLSPLFVHFQLVFLQEGDEVIVTLLYFFGVWNISMFGKCLSVISFVIFCLIKAHCRGSWKSYRKQFLDTVFMPYYLLITRWRNLENMRFRHCRCFHFIIFYYTNHNYNKIVKSDWLSTALISALIGQFNRTVRVMPK